ncbi:MAG: protein kinase domain-containing protein [Myxococcota bacterium]
MSDDRFKQARKSLIDRNRERQKKSGGQDADEYDEDEATQMVDLDRLQSGGPPPSDNGEAGDEDGARTVRTGAVGGQGEYDPEEATQMFEVPDAGPPQSGGVQIRGGGSAPDESTAPSREALNHPGPGRERGGGGRGQAQSAPAPSRGAQDQQVLSPGGADESGYDGKTDFINIDDFAAGATEFAPEQQSAGYEGSTQFVSIDALTGGGPDQGPGAGGGSGIEADPVLNQTYQFTPDAIQRGGVTLIFAQNALGKDVVLRQIWEGDPSQMPGQMRQRIGELDDLSHPNLVSLNGVFAAQSGLWAELQRPEGFRLTAVLEQHGAQDEENVLEWMTTVADVLDTIHQAQLIYANLTPNAIWITEDSTVVLEPFDVLSFEHRGELGPFGPPELAQAEQGAQLQPATDVFSLAAVTTAALTGLPFDPMRLNELENQKLADGIKAALKQNPEDRPQSAGEFIESLQGGGLSLNPEDWDIKIVAGIATVLMLGFAGFMYWQQNQTKPSPPSQASAQASQEPAAGEAEKGGAAAAAAQGQELNAKGEPPKAEAPGDVIPDPRVEIHTSFRYNPPEDSEGTADPGQLSEEADALRESARESMEEANGLADSEKEQLYKSALADLTKAIRMQGKITTQDDELLTELQSKDVVKEFQEDIRSDVRESIRSGDVGDARFRYRKWASIDPAADAGDFFEKASSAQVRFISKIEDEKEDD